MRLADALPAPSAERLRTLESHFGVRFPPAYREFLARHNGARVLDGDVGTLVVERFLPILDDFGDHPDGWADVAVVATQLDARLAVDPDATGLPLVPIAALFAGDMLVLDYRGGQDEPSVGRWDHEASDDFHPVVTTVAGTFAAFAGQIWP